MFLPLRLTPHRDTRRVLWVVLFLHFLLPCWASGPVITEFMANNRASLLDEDGTASDWIEVHNPTPSPVNLAGWFLTDKEATPTQWRFPDRVLEPGAFLIVFASGKNRTGLGPLHTNFRLEASGDYLALFPPSGEIPTSVFKPRFPAQDPDVSFGIPQGGRTQDLLSGTSVWLLLPTTPNDLPAQWTVPGTNSQNGWTLVSGLGLGFDTTPLGSAPDLNLARKGSTQQSTTGFGLTAQLAIDGNLGTFTHTDSNDNASTWQLNLGTLTEIKRIILRNRDTCCQSRLRDVTVNLLAPNGTTVLWSSGLLNPENILKSPQVLNLDFFELNLGTIEAQIIQVTRKPDPDLSGSAGQGNIDEDNVLSLGEVEVFGVGSISYGPLIRNDLIGSMRGRTPSAFVRTPFLLENLDSINSLKLHLRYDDGVVVFLNGEEIISRNTPRQTTWKSTALTKRDKALALQAEIIDLAKLRHLLRTGTNWLAFHGLNSALDDSDFLLDASLIAETGGPTFNAYLARATPGSSNRVDWNLGRVSDTRFSVDRGIYKLPFDLVLSTRTEGAQIRYTLDGSLPTWTHGTLATGPLKINRTTVVRAAAFKADYQPTDVDTHTYLFLTNSVDQPTQPTGFPTTWAGISADYAMDPRITRATAYAPRMEESLRSLPSLSITTPIDNLFGSSGGIYANPERSGADWERAVSLEWIRTDGTGDFQVDCGLRIQGGYFRQRGVSQKHSLRLLFKGAYGSGRLNQDLFHEFGAVRDFDTLVLRAGANDGYSWGEARDTEQFIRDEFGRRSLLAMGQPSPRGQFVHLYLNGLYWGLYNLTERPAEDFSASYLGGEATEWDSINSGDVKNGSLDAWNTFLGGVRTVTTLANYQRLKGLNPDGTPNLTFATLFDSSNYIDYMLINIWGGNWDWPNKNFWFGRQQKGLAGGFKFYLWDFENTMGNNRARSPLNMVSPRSDIKGSWVGEPHDRLKSFSEYRMEFADRVQRHFFSGGTLSPESTIARYGAIAISVEPAIIAETARWGDDNLSPPQDLTDWKRERDWLLGTYLPQRTGVVLTQLRNAGLFPKIAAPTLSPSRGSVTRTTPIFLTTSSAELFYTTNGLDPRLPGGSIRPDAFRVALPDTAKPLYLTGPTIVKARARQGTEWSALNEALFTADLIAASSNHLVISEFCYQPAKPVSSVERAISSNRDDFEFVELMNVSDQAVDMTGVRFISGILFNFPIGTALGPKDRALVVANRIAFQARYGTAPLVLGEYEGNLSNDGEEIRLQDAAGNDLHRFKFLDRTPWPLGANDSGCSLVLQRPWSRPNHADPFQWRTSVVPGGSPGKTDSSKFLGSTLADANSNGQIDLFDHAFGSLLADPITGLQVSIEPFQSGDILTPHLVVTFPRNLAADDVIVVLETSESLTGPWQRRAGDFRPHREQRSPQGAVRQSFQMMNPVVESLGQFVRLAVVPLFE